MGTRLQDIVARQEQVQKELTAIEEMLEPESDDAQRSAILTDRGTVTDRLIAEWDTLEEERKPLHEREVQRTRIYQSAQEMARQLVADGDAGGKNDHTVQKSKRPIQKDPYKDLDRTAIRSVFIQGEQRHPSLPSSEVCTDFMHRAVSLAEKVDDVPTYDDSCRERAIELVERSDRKQAPLIAAHLLMTGSQDYHEAFWDYLRHPEDRMHRAALSLTGANGGYLIPFTLDPSIILTNAGSANPFRQISNIKTTATNNWNGVASAGMSAQWLTEAYSTGVSDASPSFSQVTITPQKAAAWVFGSYEILEDSDFEMELPGLLADSKDRLEEAAFATGAGTGGVPKGIVTAATTVYTTADTTGHTIAIADVYGIQAALPARFRRNAKWVSSISTINRFRQLDTAGGSSYWTNLGQGQPERLLGGGIYESTTVHSYDVVAGSLCAVYGDFSQYAIVDRIGMSVMYEPMVKSTVNPTLPSGQGGWFAFWRVGADALVAGAFRTLKLG